MLNSRLIQIPIFLSLLLPIKSFAITLKPKNYNSSRDKEVIEILSKVFFEEIYKKSKGLIKAPTKRPVPKKLTKGQLKIEAMKQRNRERLALKRGIHPSKVKTGADIVKLGKADNKELIKKIANATKASGFIDAQRDEINKLRQKVMQDHKAWRAKHLPTLKEWEKQREDYFKNIKNYKNNLITIPKVKPVSKKELKRKLQANIIKDSHFVAGAFGVKVRDQERRPTCSSFAGLRSIEVLLAQNKTPKNLSEQYFYWASKPKCQNRKCSERGSWVGYGLEFSKASSTPDIPLESHCPYNGVSTSLNETQLPLDRSCQKGAVKVQEFSYNKTLDGIIESLRENQVVIAGVKLTPNFYKNNGLILEKEKDIGGKMDSHSSGHSIAITGFMKLPSVLNEGSVCFIITNSWGSGWGYGGNACISEKWLLNNRNINPFVSVDSIVLK